MAQWPKDHCPGPTSDSPITSEPQLDNQASDMWAPGEPHTYKSSKI